MSRVASDLANRLRAGGVTAAQLAPAVADKAAAEAEAINAEGLRAQIEYLLEVFGPGEIEEIATGTAAK